MLLKQAIVVSAFFVSLGSHATGETSATVPRPSAVLPSQPSATLPPQPSATLPASPPKQAGAQKLLPQDFPAKDFTETLKAVQRDADIDPSILNLTRLMNVVETVGQKERALALKERIRKLELQNLPPSARKQMEYQHQLERTREAFYTLSDPARALTEAKKAVAMQADDDSLELQKSIHLALGKKAEAEADTRRISKLSRGLEPFAMNKCNASDLYKNKWIKKISVPDRHGQDVTYPSFAVRFANEVYEPYTAFVTPTVHCQKGALVVERPSTDCNDPPSVQIVSLLDGQQIAYWLTEFPPEAKKSRISPGLDYYLDLKQIKTTKYKVSLHSCQNLLQEKKCKEVWNQEAWWNESCGMDCDEVCGSPYFTSGTQFVIHTSKNAQQLCSINTATHAVTCSSATGKRK